MSKKLLKINRGVSRESGALRSVVLLLPLTLTHNILDKKIFSRKIIEKKKVARGVAWEHQGNCLLCLHPIKPERWVYNNKKLVANVSKLASMFWY